MARAIGGIFERGLNFVWVTTLGGGVQCLVFGNFMLYWRYLVLSGYWPLDCNSVEFLDFLKSYVVC